MTGAPQEPRSPQSTGDWLSVWTAGKTAIHLGNVAEYGEQLLPARPANQPLSAAPLDTQHRLRAARDYSGLAWFYSPEPRLVLFPGPVEPEWGEWLKDLLEWSHCEAYSDLAADEEAIGHAIIQRKTLLKRIKQQVNPLIAWGHTPDYQQLLASTGQQGPASLSSKADSTSLQRAIRTYEDKHQANELFRTVVQHHPGVRVPRQWHFEHATMGMATALWRARCGHALVCKTLQGAGGSGVTILSPAHIRAAGGNLRALAQLRASLSTTGSSTSLILEEYIDPAGNYHDITVDAIIDNEANVHIVGAGLMHVSGTAYQGVTVGPGSVPPRLAATAIAFTRDVGRALADVGHRGWFDIDFVVSRKGELCPTETNCRLTGPAVAFMIAARLAQTRRKDFVVRTLDAVPLALPLRSAPLHALLRRVHAYCAALHVQLLPTLVGRAQAERPSVGLALAGQDRQAVEVGTTLVTGLLADPQQLMPFC